MLFLLLWFSASHWLVGGLLAALLAWAVVDATRLALAALPRSGSQPTETRAG